MTVSDLLQQLLALLTKPAIIIWAPTFDAVDGGAAWDAAGAIVAATVGLLAAIIGGTALWQNWTMQRRAFDDKRRQAVQDEVRQVTARLIAPALEAQHELKLFGQMASERRRYFRGELPSADSPDPAKAGKELWERVTAPGDRAQAALKTLTFGAAELALYPLAGATAFVARVEAFQDAARNVMGEVMGLDHTAALPDVLQRIRTEVSALDEQMTRLQADAQALVLSTTVA